jgi:hypothetical protein
VEVSFESKMVRIAVIGCGLMGIKIAGEFANYGHQVRLYDSNKAKLDQAYEQIEADKHQMREEGLLPHRNFIGQILCLSSLEETVSNAEFIFEAILEDLGQKQLLFEKISDFCPVTSIIASGTLRLDTTLIAEHTLVPERTMGLRFLYPVYCIPEVEITPNKYTVNAAIDMVRSLLERMGKTLFYRSGGEPLVLTEDQRDERKKAHLEKIRPRFGGPANGSIPALLHYGTMNASQDDMYVPNAERDCAICMDQPRDSLLCPCHHLVTCNNCAKSLLSRRDGCPICRKEISEIIRVYHS